MKNHSHSSWKVEGRIFGKLILLIFLMTFCSRIYAENFAQAFQKAHELRRQRKFDQAKEVYLSLLEMNPQKLKPNVSNARNETRLELVICSLMTNEGEKATEYAEKISDEYMRKYAHFLILRKNREKDEIVALLKDEDFSKWPQKYIYDVASSRAEGFFTSDPRRAEQDFMLALKYTMSPRGKATVYSCLGSLYEEVIEDSDKAFEFYKKGLEHESGIANNLDLASGAARILSKKGEKEAAITILEENITLEDGTNPYWKCQILMAYGDVHAGNGNKEKALEYYGKAKSVDGAADYLIKTVDNKIDSITDK